jgi:outer membrane protein TolC
LRLTVRLMLVALALSGCATYRPLPLPTAPRLNPGSGMAGPPWAVEDVVARALRDDPDLTATRRQHATSEARRQQAGLLPDPSLGGAVLPLVAGPGATLAWNASVSEDLRALVTLRARREEAKAAALQVDAQILWQEWQVAAQARLLAVQIIEGERALGFQREALGLYSERATRLRNALQAGNVALGAVAPDVAAAQTAQAQVGATERLQLGRRHQLNALLGREPDAPLSLASRTDVPPLDGEAIDRAAADLSSRRPDLIALRLGYRAQEARTRLAILMQFPSFALGATGGSDNSNVRNVGPQIATTLPIFDGNRGDIAVQRATREQLRAEYQARLDAAYGQLRAAVSELKVAETALAIIQADLPSARAVMDQARRSLDAGNLDEMAYVDFAAAYYAKAGEAAALEEAILEQRLAIAAITGAGLPRIEALPDIAS